MFVFKAITVINKLKLRLKSFFKCQVSIQYTECIRTTWMHIIFFLPLNLLSCNSFALLVMDIFTAAICVLATLFASLYLVAKKRFSFWEGTNYPFIKPSFPYGSLQGLMTKVHIVDKTTEFYRQMKGKGPFGGLYITFNPGIIALDLDFIKTVLVREFNHFQDHGIYYNERDDPLSAHLFAIDGTKWKPQRAKLTPTFTSGKMKFMFSTILDVASKFKRTLNEICNGGGGRDVEIKDLISRFTTDVIGSCAFGIECNSLADPNAKFKVMGRRAFEDPRHSFFVQFLMGAFPNLARLFRMKVNKDDIAEFFMQTVKFNIAHREVNHIRRNDFMDLLIQMKKNGGKVDNGNVQTFSVEEIAAQSFLFFLAGFETSSTAISMALYELAQQPDLQRKARKEIQSVLAKHPSGLTYEAITQMDYVDAIING